MVIKKIFNNNAVLAKASNKQEIVVMGCGIAFKKKIGDKIEDNLIEKTFILKQKEASEKFKLLLEDIPPEEVSLCYDIIEYAKNILNTELSDYIYVTLTDHISYALKMYDEGLNKSNGLLWEIKKFYPKEFKIGLKALELIKEETGKELPEDEAGNIALHLINAQVNTSSKIEDVSKITRKIQDILNIVRYTYNIQLDEGSLNYERFVTHLKFFFERLNNKEIIDSEDDFLLKQVKVKYENAYKCMLKIEKYLEVELSGEEQLYLTLHIQRVTQR
ncbi:PRD domain-containing protein [Clostridium sardiniense]|uniref:PRD domain-containing protein n=1 Tax=Clostridium sardiniense TaxID=29369 RepID=A0ABS7KX84_CLOSR|nr:PRD domain-containing protein [Clostridium sardiniense]MBY0755405.1 PRD domain-containing protein [Clostridium sardiniense]MDQ0459853.1 beta-glucoside operon transcriptional antiterminator [Clostridium sardiniense]